jgi:hypothetical protein
VPVDVNPALPTVRADEEPYVVLAVVGEHGLHGTQVLELVGDIPHVLADIQELVAVDRIGVKDELRNAQPGGLRMPQDLSQLGQELDPIPLDGGEIPQDLLLRPEDHVQLSARVTEQGDLLAADNANEPLVLAELLLEGLDQLGDHALENRIVALHGLWFLWVVASSAFWLSAESSHRVLRHFPA